MTDRRKLVAILGIGNTLYGDDGFDTLYGDDGFGPRVARQLAETPLPAGVDVIDAGAIGIDLLDYLTGYDRVIIIDAAEMGLEPGTIRTFAPDQVRSLEKGTPLSLHSTDILGVIELAKALGKPVAEIHVVAVQPEFVGPGEHLSEEVKQAVEPAVREVRALLPGDDCL
ncbi:MAG: hydrogenase maturation protease [Planctomycetota bacterium]|jgi:hydrogenase maturation protease